MDPTPQLSPDVAADLEKLTCTEPKSLRVLAARDRDAVVRAHRRRQHCLTHKAPGREATRLAREAGRLATHDAWFYQSLELALFPGVRKLVYARLGPGGGRVQIDELMHVALVAALDAIADYEPERGTELLGWVWPHVRRALDSALKDSHEATPREWKRVAAAAAAVQATHPGRGLGELKDLVWNRFVSDVAATIPGPQAEARRKAAERLKRQSIYRAIYKDDLGRIMATDARPTTLGVVGDVAVPRDASPTDAQIVGLLIEGMADLDQRAALARFGAALPGEVSGTPGRGYDDIARALGTSKHRARDAVAMAKARIGAPHVQWCRLASTLDTQWREELYDPVALVAARGTTPP